MERRSLGRGSRVRRCGRSCCPRSTRRPGTRTARSSWGSSSRHSRSALILTLISTGLTILLAGIGVRLHRRRDRGSRLVARIERWRAFVGDDRHPVPHPYRPLRGSILDILRAEFADESRWRDVLYVAINFPLAVFEFLVVGLAWAGALASLTLPAWFDAPGGPVPPRVARLGGRSPAPVVAASLSQLVIALHRQVVAGLLCTSESRELRRQVETLRESRSAVLDVEASELHRIERDLHDGAQQRLVMLTIDLGLASGADRHRPRGAKELDPRRPGAGARGARRDPPTSSAASRRRSCSTAGSCRRSSRSPAAGRSGRRSWQRPRARRATAACRSSGRRTSSSSEALANVAKHSGATRCEVALPPRGRPARRRGLGRRRRRRDRGARWRAGGPRRVASPASTARLMSRARPAARRSSAPRSRSRSTPRPRCSRLRNRGRPAPPGRAGGRLPISGSSSLPKMLLMCFSVAPSVMVRSLAIPTFVRPSAIAASTSRSRGVKAASGSSGRVRTMSWATTSASSAVPPRATRRSASMNSGMSPTRSLSR